MEKLNLLRCVSAACTCTCETVVCVGCEGSGCASIWDAALPSDLPLFQGRALVHAGYGHSLYLQVANTHPLTGPLSGNTTLDLSEDICVMFLMGVVYSICMLYIKENQNWLMIITTLVNRKIRINRPYTETLSCSSVVHQWFHRVKEKREMGGIMM